MNLTLPRPAAPRIGRRPETPRTTASAALSRGLLPLAVGAAILSGALLGVIGEPMIVAVLVTIVVGGWLLLKRYGAVAVIAPAFLFPVGLYQGVWGLTLLGLACAYWATGAGRPRISPYALGSVGVLALAYVIAGFGTPEFRTALDVVFIWLAGVILGASVAANPRAIRLVGLFCIPLALLALWEVSGGTNHWANAVGSSQEFGDLATKQGAGRALSTFGHPLIAGDVLAVIAVLVLASTWRWRLPVAALVITGVVATVSRSSLAALVAGILVLVVLTGGKRAARTAVGVLVAAAVVFVLVQSIPALQDSIDARLTSTTGQQVREFGRAQLIAALSDPTSHVFGGGYGASMDFAEQNQIVAGYTIFDNWYTTAIWDLGLLPLIAATLLAALGIRRADPAARKLALPAIAVLAVALFYTDGVYWSSVRLVEGMVLGLATFAAARSSQTAPDEPAPELI